MGVSLNSFRIKIGVRISLVIIFGFSGIYVLTQTYFWLVSIWLFLFMSITFYDLIRYIERSKRDLSNFLLGIQQNDFSNTYSLKRANKLDFELNHAYTTIINEFQKLRREKESNYHFLQAVVEHSGIPLIGYSEGNLEITLMNGAAKELFKKPHLTSVKAISRIDPTLGQVVSRLESGQKELVKVVIDNELLNLSVIAKEIKLDEGWYKLISFQNIKTELDEKEIESWQKLIRVLTHEIKNSAIPISTLTEVINQMITDETGELRDLSKLDPEDLEDLKIGIRTVQKRSKGLVSFVNAYGQLAKIPEPSIKKVNVSNLIKEVTALLQHDYQKNHIKLNASSNESLFIHVDAEMIEQVLINLLKNAREALHDNRSGEVTVQSYLKSHQTIISVKDNGPGIDHETLEQIFIPFYTTKKEGSGIGLSLSLQIMRAHKGKLKVHSQPGKGTTFDLIF
ncbi:ATP-binding protein [Fulvivirga sp. M361]|nr:ATP-binding protein [Fulvivirga sp. M361]